MRTVAPLLISGCLLAAAAAPKFEVTSVKPCGDARADRKTGEVFPGVRGGGRSSSGRLRLGCWTVQELIQSAYLEQSNEFASTAIEGGPDLECNQRLELGQRFGGIGCWINSDRFTIYAKSEGAPGQEAMRGPMLQTLLADRFKLKVHRETREVSVYELTVAPGGPKLQVSEAKTSSHRLQTPNGWIVRVEAQATSLGEFAGMLGFAGTGLGRPVIDKPGSRAGSISTWYTSAPQLRAH